MKKQIKLLLIIIAVFVSSACTTTQKEQDLVPRSVENYLYKNGTDCVHYELSDTGGDNGYRYVEQAYDVYADIETVWLDYRKTSPVLAFDSRIIDFGVVFNPEKSVLFSACDPSVPPFGEGQIFILNLKFMGIYNFPVAFKLSKIDSEKKMIEFIYMKKNVANGFQRIYLTPAFDSYGTAVTHVEHISFFKSNVGLSDRFVYPPFHRKTIDDFHQNIFKINGLSWNIPKI